MKSRSAGLVAGLLLLYTPAGAASAAAPSCGADTGKPATGEPIVIGAITGKTGPDDFSSSTKAAKAYFECVNANGGIHGRPIDYRIADDQWNPELAAQLAFKLVKDDKALAMVGNASFVECGANADFYTKSGIVVVAGVGVPRECFYGKSYVTTNAGPRVSTAAALLYGAKTLGAKSFVCIGPNIPGVGEWECDGAKKLGEKLGYPVQVIIMDPGSADFTSIVLEAAASKPDAIVLGLPKGLTVPLLQAAADQGLNEKIPFLSAASAYDLSVPAAIGSAWDGKFYANMEFNDAGSTAKDNQNWLAVLDKFGKPSDPRDTFSQGGYLAARIATQALLTLPANQITRENVTKAIGAIRDYKSDIFCTPWYYDPNATHHNPNSTTRMSVAKDGKWKAISDCLASEDPDLADIREFETKAGIGK
jgi:branched-chain amino acid transport system substrate-binding protein